MAKYHYESGQIANDRENECFLGRKVSCWEQKFEKAFLDMIKAVITAYVQSALTGTVDWDEVVKALKKSGVVGAAMVVIEIYIDDKCKCNSSEPTVEQCKRPKGISIMSGSCEPLEQYVEAWGFSATTAPGTVFHWVVQNGTFPDNGNLQNAITISPFIRVRQTNPNQPLHLACALSCTAPLDFYIAENFDLPTLVGLPGSLFITGPLNVYLNYESTYLFWGSWKTHNSEIVFSGCTPHGQVLEQGNDFVKIKWVSKQPPYPVPTVTAIAKNWCSNNSITKNLNVTIE